MILDRPIRRFHSEQALTRAELLALPHASAASWEEVRSLLVSPDSGLPLAEDAAGAALIDANGNRYPRRAWGPLLIPRALHPFFTDRLAIPASAVTDSFLQYFQLCAIKQSGETGAINAAVGDVHYQRHLYRMREFLRSARGIVLDIGCDDSQIGAGLCPAGARYVGLDPFGGQKEHFRVIGFGERLPFKALAFNGVMFNTTLDHMLDWHHALDEADRVLAPGGTLYISSLVWTKRASLLTDAVHFHHFRDYELLGAMPHFDILDEQRYDYKGDTHRYGLYLALRKPDLVPAGS